MCGVVTNGESATSMRSLSRAIDVLEVLESAPSGLRLSEIARRADLHVSTAQRILVALEQRGRVERDDNRYRAGAGLLFGAHAYLTGSPLVINARPVLQELAASTELTASVFVRTGFHRAVIARVVGSDPLRYELPVGERLPLHVGAGKTLAAQFPDEDRERLVAEVTPYVAASGREWTAAALREELDRVRAQGYAVASGERVLGTRSVSAPVRDPDGEAVAAMQVTGTLEAFPEDRVPSLAAVIRNAADRLGRQL